ncbi:MAG: aspartate carbamoyltransferase [Methylococcales bacterium]|nr:aspartate carbamoyltransferase [Methylococcales bacterium]
MNYLWVSALSLFFIMNPVYAIEKASEKRLDEIAELGVHVMPFDLALTTHVFSKTAKGGVQKVLVKNPDDCEQIKLIREHLSKISAEFQQGDFSNPEKIHGNNMPGLEGLRKAKLNQLNITYKELPNGAKITYLTDEISLITAIHQWFEAQLSDHSRHAVSGHSNHKMHAQ